MTNTLKNAGSSLTTGGGNTTIYTVPASTTTTVLSMMICNTHTAGITVDATLYRGGTTPFKFCYGLSIALNGVLVAIGESQKVVMMTGDIIKVQTYNGPCDVIMSFMESA